MLSSPVNSLIDKSRLSMPEYKDRFIPNPKKLFGREYFFVCVSERQTDRQKETECVCNRSMPSIQLFYYMLY